MDVGSSLIGVQKQLADVEEVDLLRTGWKIRGKVGKVEDEWMRMYGEYVFCRCDDVF